MNFFVPKISDDKKMKKINNTVGILLPEKRIPKKPIVTVKAKNKIIFLFFILSLFTLLVNKSERLNKSYESFYSGLKELSKILPEINKDYPELEKYKNSGIPFHETEAFTKFSKNYNIFPNITGHTSLYITSIDLFKDSPFFGRGIKSFRNTCREKWHLPNRSCQLHPHHTYLEILNDTGIVGFAIIIFTILTLFIKNFNRYYKNNKKKIKNLDLVFYAVFISLLIEFLPFRSHGSFFSTSSASYIFLLIGIFYGLYELKLIKTSKKRFNFQFK